MTTAWGTGALSLSAWPSLDKGRGKDKVGGDEKAAATGGAAQDKDTKLLEIFINLRVTIVTFATSPCVDHLPESFAGAGDNGGAESFIDADSEDSFNISIGASLSNFLFRDPMAGFV